MLEEGIFSVRNKLLIYKKCPVREKYIINFYLEMCKNI